MRPIRTACVVGLITQFACAPAGSAVPDSTRTATLAPVAVTGAANAAQIRYRDLLAGVEAFHKYRHYAPNATLSFYLAPQSEVAASPPIALELQTEKRDIDVPVAADGKFALPSEKDVGDDDGFLVANRADGKVGVEPRVRSIADNETQFRLGDLRLQCEVSWAIEKQNVPKAIRTFFFIGGRMCHSSKIAVNYFHSPHKLSKVELSYNGRHADIPVARDDLTLWPPLGDTSWPDDAVVTLTFKGVESAKAGR